MGEHGEGDVPVPADILSDFVLLQAAFVHRGQEAFSIAQRIPATLARSATVQVTGA